MHKPSSIAILGATGHVGKILAAGLADRFALTLYARRPEVARAFAGCMRAGAMVEVVPLSQFGCPPDDPGARAYDTVVNCVGVGNPAALVGSGVNIFALTEEFDRLTLGYLAAYPDGRLISFSSGAAYGGTFEKSADENSWASFPANSTRAADLYGIAKLASEARHRAASNYSIVDLRLFGLFSRHIDLGARYLMNDIVAAIGRGTTLVTGPEDIVRDYVDPGDLVSLVSAIVEAKPINDVFDVYSAEPVRKFALLDVFAERYGLTYAVDSERDDSSPTGVKLNYFSTNHRAAAVGYAPCHASIESLRRETDAVLQRSGGG